MKILFKYGNYVVVKNNDDYEVYPMGYFNKSMIKYFEKPHDRFRAACYWQGYNNIATFRAEQYKGYSTARSVNVVALAEQHSYIECI